ncbi:2,3-diketo-L-gulonate reductase [compost metagenome]
MIDGKTRDEKLQRIMDYVSQAERDNQDVAIRLPGHKFPGVRATNQRDGIPVDERVWARIQAL